MLGVFTGEAMPQHGTVFLVEPALEEERAAREFEALLDAAGLRLVDITRVPPPTGFSVLRAVRAAR